MDKGFVISELVRSSQFARQIAAPAGIGEQDVVTLREFSDGQIKLAYKLEPPHGPPLVAKEIRFNGERDRDDKFGNRIVTLDMEINGADVEGAQCAQYELLTLQKIAKARKESKFFPELKGVFAYTHPETDGYSDRVEYGGKFVSVPAAMKALDDGHGASFIIVENFVEGRGPTHEELARAKEIRDEGMKRAPRLWLTADTDEDDIIVRPNGDLVFIDVGKFGDLPPAENAMLSAFLSEDVPSLRRPGATSSAKHPRPKHRL